MIFKKKLPYIFLNKKLSALLYNDEKYQVKMINFTIHFHIFTKIHFIYLSDHR